MTVLNELLERVKAATGPDRNIDAMIYHWSLNGVGTGNYADAPSYTSSIDAALALVERMFPGEGIVLETHGKCVAGIGQSGKFPTQAPTAPVAILAALLHAVSQEHK